MKWDMIPNLVHCAGFCPGGERGDSWVENKYMPTSQRAGVSRVGSAVG